MILTMYFKILEKQQIAVVSGRENKLVTKWSQVMAG